MKILALNSSPRPSDQSKTELMLRHLLDGMREAGACVESVNLRDKVVKNCIGCFTCWTKTPGVCIHQDDMTRELLPAWLESDIAVYATPLYNYGVNATLKTFLERTLPTAEPFFEIHNGRVFHPLRSKSPEIVVLSVAGLPEAAHFGPLSAHMQYMLASPGRRLMAEIYRPSSELLKSPAFKTKSKEIIEATIQTGRELVKEGAVSPETLALVTQPLIEPEELVKMGNLMWRKLIDKGMSPNEFREKSMVFTPTPIDLRD